ncbi:MAG: OmpA family protein [Telluria sp.]
MMLAVLSLAVALAAETPVIVSGIVPDEATHAAIVARLRGQYGAGRVVDQLTVGRVSAPAGWADAVGRLAGPDLRLVSKGRLQVEGTNIGIEGEVQGEAQHRQVLASLAGALDGSYTLRDSLRAGAPEQALLDAALANRIIEFESGKADLTPQGRAILDQMAAALGKVGGKHVEVIGHTDNEGPRAANLALSHARAEAVRSYLAARGIAPDLIAVAGAGPDKPVADNASAEGRARNRRIEFRVLQ